MKNCKTIFIEISILFTISTLLLGQTIKWNGEKISSTEIDKFIKYQMDSLQMPGLSITIINNGKIVYHNAFGIANVETKAIVDEQSIFETGSLSKPVFAYFVMKMVDKGVLNLDTPLYKYMPYPDIEKDVRYKTITARMVLTHQTGLPNWRYFDLADSSMHIKQGDLYLKFTPGTNFSYSGEAYVYLAKVIAHLNNRTLQNLEPLFQQEVALPLKMQHASYTGNTYISQHKVSGHTNGKVAFWHGVTWPISFPDWDSTYFNPAASLHSDALSYAQFVIGLMNGKGLTKKSFDEMLKPQIILDSNSIMHKETGVYAWGLGIAITKTPNGIMYEHGGNNGNFQSGFVFFKSQKKGYVFLTNCEKGSFFDKALIKFLTNGKL
jgi:CubicO group peptidase (beta-lactamase class C family)